jgi:hypothetical protein
MTGTIHVRARVSTDDGTLADTTFTVDPSETATPWFDVMVGLVDIGRAARALHRQELTMAPAEAAQ